MFLRSEFKIDSRYTSFIDLNTIVKMYETKDDSLLTQKLK